MACIAWLSGQKDGEFEVKSYKPKRSLSANSLLWQCLGEIAEYQQTDKWSVYLKYLREYGKFTYICVKPSAVDAVKKQWRESEEIGEIRINGKKAIQMLCYFGTSTYDTKEFSHFLDMVITDMRDMGLVPPTEREVMKCLERYERSRNGTGDMETH